MPQKPPTHQPSPRPRRRRRRSASARGYGHAWRKVRGAYLEAHPLCERCGEPAAEVHHRLPRILGGGDEPENLEALCKPCHNRTTARTARPRRVADRGASRVVLVCGPPGAGKSTYVRQHMAGGDVVVDVDTLLAALTGRTLDEQCSPQSSERAAVLGVVLAARDAVLHASKVYGRVRVLWVISCAATLQEARRALAPHCLDDDEVGFVLLKPSAGECYRRIAEDGTRQQHAHDFQPIVDAWFRRASDGELARLAERKNSWPGLFPKPGGEPRFFPSRNSEKKAEGQSSPADERG